MGDGVAGSDWTYEMPPGKLVGNLRMLTEERYAALIAAEAERDRWQAMAEEYARRNLAAVQKLAAAEQRATRLEEAARQVLDERGTRTLTSGLRRLEVALRSLAAPPGEDA